MNGSGSNSALIIDLDTRWGGHVHATAASPSWENLLVPEELDGGWATLTGLEDKSLAPIGDRTTIT